MGVTPLHIEIAMHYHCKAEGQWPMLHVPIHRQYANDLKEAGLLKLECAFTAGPVVGYEKTDGLAVWIDAICSTPFPVKQWVMPKPKADTPAGERGIGWVDLYRQGHRRRSAQLVWSHS